MAIEVERLVATVTADINGLRGELGRAMQITDQASTRMAESLRTVAPAVRMVEGAVGALRIVLGGYVAKELFQATKGSVEYISALKDAAGQLNVNVERLQSLRYAFDQSGLSSEAADSALRKLSVSIGNAVLEGGDAAKAFDQLGVQLTDAQGNTRDTAEVFDDLVAKFATVQSAAERNAMAVQMFGREAGPKMGELLSQGAAALQALEAQAEATGAVLNKGLVDEVEALGDRLSALGAITKNQAAAALSTALGPAVEGVTYLVAELVTGINETIQGIRVLAGMGADPLDEKIDDTRERVEALNAAIASGRDEQFFKLGVTNVAEANEELRKQQTELQRLKDLQLDLLAAQGKKPAAGASETGLTSKFVPREESSQDRLAAMVKQLHEEEDAIAEHNTKVADTERKRIEDHQQWFDAQVASDEERMAEVAAFHEGVEKTLTGVQAAAHQDRLNTQKAATDAIIEDETRGVDERLGALQRGHDLEVEMATAAYQRQIEAISAIEATSDDERADRQRALEEAEAAHMTQLERIDAESLERRRALEQNVNQERLNAARSALVSLSALMASESRKQFEVGKTAAIAETIISTYKGAQQAYSALSGIPYVGPALGAAAAIAAIAAGLARVNAIKSTTFGSRSVGVGVGGGLTVGNSGSAPGASQGADTAQRTIVVSGINPNDLFTGRQMMDVLNQVMKDGGRLAGIG